MFQWHKDLFMCASLGVCLPQCATDAVLVYSLFPIVLHCLPICACVIVLVCISFLSLPGCVCVSIFVRVLLCLCVQLNPTVTDVTVARTYVKACQATFSMNSQFLSSFNEKYFVIHRRQFKLQKVYVLCTMPYLTTSLANYRTVGLLFSFRWFRLSSFNILYCLCCWLSQVHFTKSCQPNIRAKMLERVVVWLASASPPLCIVCAA